MAYTGRLFKNYIDKALQKKRFLQIKKSIEGQFGKYPSGAQKKNIMHHSQSQYLNYVLKLAVNQAI